LKQPVLVCRSSGNVCVVQSTVHRWWHPKLLDHWQVRTWSSSGKAALILPVAPPNRIQRRSLLMAGQPVAAEWSNHVVAMPDTCYV
jgi:hypothetical protein